MPGNTVDRRSKSILDHIADAVRQLTCGGFCRSSLAGAGLLSLVGICFSQDGARNSQVFPVAPPGTVSADYRKVDGNIAAQMVATESGFRGPLQAPDPTALQLSTPQEFASAADESRRPAVDTAICFKRGAHGPVQNNEFSADGSAGRLSGPQFPQSAAAASSIPITESATALMVGHGQMLTKDGTPISVYPEGVKLRDSSYQQRIQLRQASAQLTLPQNRPGGHSFGADSQPAQQLPPAQLPPVQLAPPIGMQNVHGQLSRNRQQPQNVPKIPNLFPEPQISPQQTPGPVDFHPPDSLQLPMPGTVDAAAQLPADTFVGDDDLSWWENHLSTSIMRGRQPLPMTLQQSLGLALSEAPELKVLQSDWYIQQLEVTRRDAAFDWTTFVNSVWNRDSTPVGSQLDGATNRLRSRSAGSRGGVRRTDRDGGEFEMSQNLGINSSNSQFISPNNQGNSRLALRYERPLLRGSGHEYNTSAVRLAEIEKDTAFDRFRIGVQDHLLDTATAYWALVLRRGRFVQAVSSWNRSKNIADEMAGRVNVDVTPTMLDRTRSEVANRLANAIRSEHEVIAAQDALLRLIYGSRFTEFTSYEVLTQTLPMKEAQPMSPEPQIQVALSSRPEIHRSIRDIKAAAVRFRVAENEILPVLNLVLTGYVAGLRGNNDIGGSFLNQFSQGEPGAGIGLNYEIPYRNRAAQAAAEQGKIAIKRMQSQLETSIAEVTEDVRAQVIERNMNGAVLQQQWESLARSKRILKYTQARREALADGNQVADLYLENLLQMQSRLENAEFTYLQSQVRFAIADNALLRAIASLDTLAEGSAGACDPSMTFGDQAFGISTGSTIDSDELRGYRLNPQEAVENAGVTPASYRQIR